MPVRYIQVNPKSELFVGATRAFGNIAIVGQTDNAATAAVNVPTVFTDPDSARAPFAGNVARAVALAFRQSPGPTTIYAVRVAAANPDWDAALEEVAKLDVQIVLLANTPLNAYNAATVGKLAAHVGSVSNTGGDGKERIAVAMLAKDATDPAIVAGTLVHERMYYVAHRADEDAAAAVAGVIAGYEPHVSMLLKPVNVNMIETFTDGQIDAFDGAKINWLTDPVLFPGRGLFLGEGYAAPADPTKVYIDVVRTLDDVSFRLKAALIRAIGNFRVDRAGLRALQTLARAVLSPLEAQGVIESFTVHIPLLSLLDRDPASLTADEIAHINGVQATRRIDMATMVEYAGAIHRLRIDLVFK